MHHLITRFLALLILASSAFAQSTPIKNLTLQGTFNGTPTGGTLNLGSVTLSATTYGFSGDADTYIDHSDPNEISIYAGGNNYVFNATELSTSQDIRMGGSLNMLTDLEKIIFYNSGAGVAANIYYWTAHDANGGELIIDGQNRIAIAAGGNGSKTGAIQLGTSSNTFESIIIQHNGDASGGTTTMPGKKLIFPSSYWNGSAAVYDIFSMRASWDSTVNTLTFYDNDPGSSSSANNQAVGTALMQLREGEGLQMSANRALSFATGTGRASTQTNLGFAKVYKTADTSRNTTTSMTADNHLTLALSTGVHRINVMLIHANAGATPGFSTKFTFSGTSDYSSGHAILGRHGVNTVLNTSYPNGTDTTIFAPTLQNGSFADGYVEVSALVSVTVAGDFVVTWAQYISDAANTTLKKGSFITAQKIAD